MANVRVKLNIRGGREILQSDEVRADLLRRAEAIKAEAGGDGFEAGAEIVGNRVMGWVVTSSREAKRAEAEDRTLTRALDAGRD